MLWLENTPNENMWVLKKLSMYGNAGETTRVATPVTKANCYHVIMIIIWFLFKKTIRIHVKSPDIKFEKETHCCSTPLLHPD